MKLGTWAYGPVLGALLVVVPSVAQAAGADSASPFASAVKTTFAPAPAPAPPTSPMIFAAGFTVVHYYETTYVGGYGTFGFRLTDGDYPLAIVAQFATRNNGDEHPFTVVGGVQVGVFHNDTLCVSARGMFGPTHWSTSTDFTVQITGAFEIHTNKDAKWGIDAEFGFIGNHETDFGLAKGFVAQGGVVFFIGGK